MSDITPKAQELADEKGIDLSQVEGSGKDGRILVEDVEKLVEEKEGVLEAEDPAEDAEVVGEVAGDPLVVSQPSPLTSVEAFKAHPHVPVDQQDPVELKDFIPEELETVEGTAEQQAAEAEEEDSDKEEEAPESTAGTGVAGPYGANDPESAEDDGPGSSSYLRTRGDREKGFYNLPPDGDVNPHAAAERERAAEAADEQDADAEKAAEQQAQVDTSGEGEATHGESLREAAPSVAEVAGDEAPDTSSDN